MKHSNIMRQVIKSIQKQGTQSYFITKILDPIPLDINT